MAVAIFEFRAVNLLKATSYSEAEVCFPLPFTLTHCGHPGNSLHPFISSRPSLGFRVESSDSLLSDQSSCHFLSPNRIFSLTFAVSKLSLSSSKHCFYNNDFSSQLKKNAQAKQGLYAARCLARKNEQ